MANGMPPPTDLERILELLWSLCNAPDTSDAFWDDLARITGYPRWSPGDIQNRCNGLEADLKEQSTNLMVSGVVKILATRLLAALEAEGTAAAPAPGTNPEAAALAAHATPGETLLSSHFGQPNGNLPTTIRRILTAIDQVEAKAMRSEKLRSARIAVGTAHHMPVQVLATTLKPLSPLGSSLAVLHVFGSDKDRERVREHVLDPDQWIHFGMVRITIRSVR